MVRIKSEIREQVIEQARETLLKAAAEELALKGFDQANINTISNNAGYAKGTIYNYFPSKQALLTALIDSIAQEHLVYMRSAIMEVDDPAGRVENFFCAGFEYVASHAHRARVMFNTINGADQAQRRYCFQAYQPMFALVNDEVLLPGINQGVFYQAELQPTALLLMSIYLGTASQVDERGRPWLDPDLVASFALRALRSRE